MTAKKITKPKGIKRRDATGHLDPKYAQELRAQGGHVDESSNAFLSRARSGDALAEQLGEAVIATATTGEDGSQDVRDAEVTEEFGGPFVTTEGKVEFAHGTDASNPKRSKREPFPRT